MKSIVNILLRLIMVACTVISFFLLLTSNVSLKINDTQAMGKEVINRVVQESDNSNLKIDVQLLEDTGLEQTLLDQLPKKYQIEMSYADLYRLCEKYNEKGKLSTTDLGLTSKTKLEEIINEYLVKQINNKLDEKSEEISHVIIIYEYSIFGVGLLFLLAAILIIFGRAWASIPLTIAALGSFVVLWIFSNEVMTSLQSRVYSGILVTLSSNIWLGLIIAIGTAIGWPFIVSLMKRIK